MHAPALIELIHGAVAPDGLPKVIAIDGRSGAGKTTLAGWVAAQTGGSLLSLEHSYPGWDGLRGGVELVVREVFEPLAAGARTVQVPRWDWEHDRPAEPYVLEVREPLIFEGVGAASSLVRPYLAASIWVEADARARRRRAFRRDGDTYKPHWERWARQEDELLAQERTPEHADMVITA